MLNFPLICQPCRNALFRLIAGSGCARSCAPCGPAEGENGQEMLGRWSIALLLFCNASTQVKMSKIPRNTTNHTKLYFYTVQKTNMYINIRWKTTIDFDHPVGSMLVHCTCIVLYCRNSSGSFSMEIVSASDPGIDTRDIPLPRVAAEQDQNRRHPSRVERGTLQDEFTSYEGTLQKSFVGKNRRPTIY